MLKGFLFCGDDAHRSFWAGLSLSVPHFLEKKKRDSSLLYLDVYSDTEVIKTFLLCLNANFKSSR